MPGGRVALVRVAVAVAVAVAVVSSARVLQRACRGGWPTWRDDAISRYTERFTALRGDLPASGSVGYLGDREAPRIYHGLEILDFNAARYALRPLRLERDGAAVELFVANFVDARGGGGGAAVRAAARARGLVLVRDYGDGVSLWRRSR